MRDWHRNPRNQRIDEKVVRALSVFVTTETGFLDNTHLALNM